MATYRTVVSSKGRVVIPAELREQLGLQKGTPATWREDGGKLIPTPMTLQGLKEIIGFQKTKPGEPSMFEESCTRTDRCCLMKECRTLLRSRRDHSESTGLRGGALP